MSIQSYTYHAASKVFPMMDAVTRESLKTNVKANGVLIPIVTYNDQILDGRNRYEVAKELEAEGHELKKIEFTEFVGTEAEAHEFAMAAGAQRRDLTSGQKASAVVLGHLLAQRLKKKDLPAEDSGAMTAKVKGDVAAYLTRIAGTNRTYIFRALKVGLADRALLEAVSKGETTLNDAARSIEAISARDDSNDAKEEVKDGNKNPVPDEFLDVFIERSKGDEIKRLCRNLLNEIESLATGPGGHFIDAATLKDSVGAITKHVSANMPHCLCPDCSGMKKKDGKICPTCRKAGYVGKAVYKAWEDAQKSGDVAEEETADQPAEA